MGPAVVDDGLLMSDALYWYPCDPPLEQAGERNTQALASLDQMDRIEGGKIDRVTPRNSQMRYSPLQNRLSTGPLRALSFVDVRVRVT